MNKHSAIRSLLWKDSRLILALVLIALLSIFACNLALFLAWQNWGMRPESLASASIAIWIVMPGLVAFGAASMLVGTEEESGSLAWLRTLPVSWWEIAVSKLIVGFGAFALVWTCSSVILWLFSHGWQVGNSVRREPPYLGLDGVIAGLFFEIALLLLGFIVAYWFRNPIAGLLSLIVFYVAFVIGFFVLINILELAPEGEMTSGAVLAGILWLLASGLAQHALARRRLTGVLPQRWLQVDANVAPSRHYRPPSLGNDPRPSQAVALLWQQVRQTLPIGVPVIGVSAAFLFVYVVAHLFQAANPRGPLLALLSLSIPCILLGGSWLGALVFYGDNQRRHYQFFSDRGISCTRVWWTRMVPPMLGCLLLSGMILSTNYFTLAEGRPWATMGMEIPVLVLVLFAFGQLVSQWVDRPVLAFLAAPAYAFVSLTPLFYFFAWQEASPFALLLVVVPILLFASWHLSRDWLSGRDRAMYTARVIAYTFAAVAAPCLLYYGGKLLHFASTQG